MGKTLVIIKREYLARVRTRAFLIGTIITPLFLLLSGAVPAFLASRGAGERFVTVLDQSGDPNLFEVLDHKIKEGESETAIHLIRVVVPADTDIDKVKPEYKKEAEENSDKSYLVLLPGTLAGVQPEYNAKNVSDFFTRERLERSLSDAITERRLIRAGLG